MPGRYDSANTAATFISAWAKYRTGVLAADDTAHPESVVPLFVLDLTKSFHGTDSQIWIALKRTAGTNTADITLFLLNNGDLVNAAGYTQAATQATAADGSQTKFTGLMAGVYVVELTNLTAGAHWDVYVAANYPLVGSTNGLTGSITQPPISTPLTEPLASDLTSKTPQYGS